MEPEARHAFLADLYGPTGLRLSVGRTCIGTSDYSTKMYSYDDTPESDPELKHFSIEQDKAWILPTLREARETNPEFYLFSCGWSPPGWTKSGGSMLGGCMKERWFATHLSILSRPFRLAQTLGSKSMPSPSIITKSHLGPGLEASSLETEIWVLDHNYNLWGRVADELSNPQVAKYVDGVAWHSYAGTPDAMSRIHEMFPDKHMYFTEGGPPAHLFGPSEERHREQPRRYPPYGTDWTRWSSSFTGMLRNWARCICVWNLLLDENGRPDITNPPRP